MRLRIVLSGLVLWTIGTVAIRLTGQHLLRNGGPAATLPLYLTSFLLMALLARRICRGLRLPRESWLEAAALLSLPTLLLDPLSCAFFSTVFPNLDPSAAGAFGGWMLACCGGAVAGAWILA